MGDAPHKLHEVFPAELREIRDRLGHLLGRATGPDASAPSGPMAAKLAGIEAAIAEGGEPKRLEPPPGLWNWLPGPLRRRSAYHQERTRERYAPVAPSARLGLVGLALSGGGIRSATFNLGVIQVLAREGILEHVDYLSTVSGGGYIGSCLSAVLTNNGVGISGDRFPFRHVPGVEEPQAIKRLRQGGSFLAPGGIVDWAKIPALLFRGVLLNFLALVPYILAVAVLTRRFFGPIILDTAGGTGYVRFGVFFRAAEAATWLFLGLVVGSPFLAWAAKALLSRQRLQDRWSLRDLAERAFGGALVVVGIALAVGGLLAGVLLFHELVRKDLRQLLTWAVSTATLLSTSFGGKAAARAAKLSGKLMLYVFGLLGPLLVVVVYFYFAEWHVFAKPPVDPGPFLWAALGIWLYTFWFLDPNVTSLHGWYRDRLSKAYLFALDRQGDVETARSNDQVRLSELNPPGSEAPYHLINGALNVQGSRDPDLSGRQSDFFLFSKRFVGSEWAGFCGTEAMERADPHLNLGTAMAISAAAAAPNTGTSTVKPLVFVLALLNVRLGYWLPNPGRVGTLGLHKIVPRPGPLLFIKELFSDLTPQSWHVNVSDGGHIENLAIYQLLERRCKLIIACDAECDPKLRCGGLATLIRYARIDMAIDIDIDLDDIQTDPSGPPPPAREGEEPAVPKSVRHWAMGTIDYGNGETGCLLYIKSSLCGRENPYIEEYAARNPSFPHESTADQFFSEEQFEAYRALGSHVANDLFPVGGLGRGGDAPTRWLDHLATNPKPRERVYRPCR